MSKEQHRKVVFRLERDSDGYPPADMEGVWAIHLGDDRYRLDNIPFFERDATLDDIVEVTERDGELWYSRTLEESENTLIRVVYYEGTDPAELRRRLSELGCSTEWSEGHQLIAVSVPASVKLSDVQAFLQGGDQESWGYEEAILRQ